jgi:hypothetical protein
MFGMKAAAQYVLPASDIKSVAYTGGATGGGSVGPIFDGTNYIIWDDGQGDLMKASPFITSGFSDVYTSGLGNTTSRNNTLSYQNGRYFLTDFGAGTFSTFTTLGGTRSTTGFGGSNTGPRNIKWYPAANCWVAIAQNSYWTSTNGTNWTQTQFAGSPGVMSSLGTNGTMLIAGGANGAMFTTTSTSLPLSWTARTSSFGTSHIYEIVYDSINAYWVAGGGTGKLAYSTNGTTWTQATTGAPVTNAIYGVVYHMGRWVLVTEGGASEKSYVIRSDTKLPNGTWTVVSTNEPSEGGDDQQIGRIFSDGKYIFWHPDLSADSGTTPRIRYCR